MYSDYTPATEDVAPQMQCFLRENHILAIECVLLARGIKTYSVFQQAQQDPTERQILLEKSLGIYRGLGGPFPHFRQNALKSCFGDNRDNQNQSLHHHTEQDEDSILNCLGGARIIQQLSREVLVRFFIEHEWLALGERSPKAWTI